MDKFVFDGQTANKGNDGIPAADMRFYCDKNTRDQFVLVNLHYQDSEWG